LCECNLIAKLFEQPPIEFAKNITHEKKNGRKRKGLCEVLFNFFLGFADKKIIYGHCFRQLKLIDKLNSAIESYFNMANE